MYHHVTDNEIGTSIGKCGDLKKNGNISSSCQFAANLQMERNVYLYTYIELKLLYTDVLRHAMLRW